MNRYEDEHVVVKPSPIEGLGVFAQRPFEKGETVLIWQPLVLSEKEVDTLPAEQKRYLNVLESGETVLMQVPERFVNRSDTPNTKTVGESDVAICRIEVGEEITSGYPL